jgi:DNA-binding transcriptional ArsR family regulator
MLGVEVIEDPQAAAIALDPVRRGLLAQLAQPASAASLAGRVGMARQKVNYHLRELERHGLVRVADQRQWGGLTERRLVATAAAYVVSPGALGPLAPLPEQYASRASADYLIALAARAVREVGSLWQRSRQLGKDLATLSLDTEVRFRSPAERAAFAHDLTHAVAELVARYHDPASPGGRLHRVIVVAHPSPVSSHGTSPPRD